MSTLQTSLYGSVIIEPSVSDAEAALSVLLSGLDDKIKNTCTRPQSVAMHLSVKECDHSVQLLESSLLVFTTVIRNRVAVFQTRRNDLTPFNSLPNELFAEILVASIPSEEEPGYDEYESIGIARLWQLASVSRRWRDVVKSCPQLWTVVGSSLLGVVALKLKKSGSLPLTIHTSDPSPSSLKVFLSITMEHCRRWSSAHISYSRSSAELEAIEAINHTLGLPMPILQYLRLLHHAPEVNLSLDLSRLTNAPLLRHLSLLYISPLDLPTSICSTLHNLHISNLKYPGHAGHMLMNVLNRCTELKNLEIHSISCIVPDDIQAPTDGPSVHLPHLEHLECLFNDESVYLSVLGRIRAEKLSWLRILDHYTDGKAVLREIMHPHEGPSLLSTVLANSDGTSLTMIIGFDLEVRTNLPDGRGLRVQFTSVSQWLEDIVQLLQEQPFPSNSPPVDLNICDSSYRPSKEAPLVADILKITQIMSQTSTLSLDCGISNIRTFFTALVEADDANFTRQLPNLTNIILPGVLRDADWEELKPIIHALEARYMDSGIAKELPFKIQYKARGDISSENEWLDGDDIDWEVAPQV